MSKIYAAAAEIQSWLDQRGWSNCATGGLAVVRWGFPRIAIDAPLDIIVATPDIDDLWRAISKSFHKRGRGHFTTTSFDHVYRGSTSSGVAFDIGIAMTTFEAQVVERARPYVFASGIELRVCDLHDLVSMKAFSDRIDDRADLEYLIAWHRKSMNWNRIDVSLESLCRIVSNRDCIARLAALRRRIKELTRAA